MIKLLRYILVLFALVSCAVAEAQNIRIRVSGTTKVVNNDTLTFYPDPRWPKKIGCNFNYQNVAAKKMVVRAKKWDISLTTKVNHSICFAGACYGPHDTLAPNADTIDSKSSSYLQGSYDYTALQTLPPNDLVAYILYDEDNPSDSAIVYAKLAEESTTGVSETIAAGNGINVFPSPANDIITFQSALHSSGTLYITNSIGQMITRQTLENGSVRLSCNWLANGVYYYSVRTSEGRPVTGSFIVAH
jgi:hypothetical protein